MSLLFEARDIQQYYGGIMALHLPDFRMCRGECVVLTGRNGSGKSTLLRLLAHIEKATHGTLRSFGLGQEPRRNICLLLQEPYLMRATVFWNVTLGLRLRKSERTMKEAYETAMRAVGFSDPATFAHRNSHALSGGERQRIALAALLILSPAVLLLDEPTSNVDHASSQAIITAVRMAVDAGSSVVCATHDPELITALDAREVRLRRTDEPAPSVDIC